MNKIETLITILKNIISKVDEFDLKKSKKDVNTQERPLNVIVIDLIIRQHEVLTAVNILMEKANDFGYTKLDHSVGLLLRSALSDTLRSFYIISQLDKEIEGVSGFNNIDRQHKMKVFFDADQLPHHKRELKRLHEKTIGTDLEETYSKYLQKFEEKYKNEFEAIEVAKIKLHSTWNMLLEAVLNDRFDPDGYWVYNYWITYSTYEHYGSITSNLDHTNDFEEEKILNMLRSIILILQGLRYLFNMMSFKGMSDFLFSQQVEISSMIKSS